MDNNLTDLVWVEKYRPSSFEDLILENKSLIVKALENPKSIPSFIFYSSTPGTGKTSTAKVIIKHLGCDKLIINSSDERGIDTIRDKIGLFASSLSSNDKIKRCIFLDEADGLTRQAQDSLRNLMETYSDNCFFIFSCNDFNKLIEPIRSRCITVNFEKPNKNDIEIRLGEICEKEKISLAGDQLNRLMEFYYPDIRTMIMGLQRHKIDASELMVADKEFESFLKAIKSKDYNYIYDKTYAGDFPIMEFNKWLFHKFYREADKIGFEKVGKIVFLLADTEKYWNMGANLEIIFISNVLEIAKLF